MSLNEYIATIADQSRDWDSILNIITEKRGTNNKATCYSGLYLTINK
jgi:hypothetical protein